MSISTRPEPYIIPAYSLTGDLLAYLNCGRQYRYQNRGSLPPSKPVQLWFGQFIHGVLEEAYRLWRDQRDGWISGGGMGPLLTFPWDDVMLGQIEDGVISRLAAQGLVYRNRAMLDLARTRAREAINNVGSSLFLLIDQAEVRLRGIRQMPLPPNAPRRADYYEVSGVVDVLTSVQLASADPSNVLLRALLSDQAVAQALTSARSARARGNSQFEIIVDYKGMRRPPLDPSDPTRQRYEWQLRTYAWLRSQQPDSSPVLAGVLLFVNELAPSIGDFASLRDEVFAAGGPQTDILPTGADESAIRNWTRANPVPTLSLAYRLSRALYVVPMDAPGIDDSLQRFDGVVSDIETAVNTEKSGATISRSWTANPSDRNCTVCDFKTFCSASRYQGTPYAP